MMRRDAGLHVEDRIVLGYEASPALAALVTAHADRIREEVGAVELQDLARSNGRPAEATAWKGTLEDATTYQLAAAEPGQASRRALVRLGASVFTAVAIVALDQVTKRIAEHTLLQQPDHSISIIGELLRLTYVQNRGAAFGILQNQSILFVIVGVAVIGAILVSYRYFPKMSLLLNIALGLQLGGAIGNLSDRVRLGYVVDFVDVAIWPVFNVADSAIVIGVAVLAFHLLKGSDDRDG
jgi:signal peptidase II